MTTKNISECLSHLGYPQNTYKTIHIGGTNGKGSTSYFLSQFLTDTYKVGLYISPYTMSRFDNIYINNEVYPHTHELYAEYKEIFQTYALTPFEEETALAYIIFKKELVDVAVIEVGLGGTNDATNVIHSTMSIVTSISLEHEEIIGPTIIDIAHHQAGIIKPNSHVLIQPMMQSVYKQIFQDKAKSVGATIVDIIPYPFKQTFPMYQKSNLDLAWSAAIKLLPEKPIEKVLKMLPFRFESMNHRVLLDGAHNHEGIQTLSLTLQDKKIIPIVIMSTLKSKNTQAMIDALYPFVKKIYVTTFDDVHAIDENDIHALKHCEFIAFDNIKSMINAFKHDIILLTGSLYFLRKIRASYEQ